MGKFDHKAFISYSHVDKLWAEKLERDLKERGYKDLFLDSERLEIGRPWNVALLRELEHSEHLIVIWSSNAKFSEWVGHERARFEAVKGNDTSRLVIHVQLDAQTEVFSANQNIQLGISPANMNDLDPDLWKDALARIVRTFELETGAKPVYKLVLTSTLPRLQKISLDHAPAFAPPFSETLEKIGLKVVGDETDAWKQKLSTMYGTSRSDWRPFGGVTTDGKSSKSINNLLIDLKDGIAAQKDAPRFIWKEADEKFWGAQEQMNSAIAELIGNLTLVVVDPVSLYDDDVRARCDKVRYRLMDSRTVISVLAPFPISPLAVHLRKLIKGSAEELYDFFYSPPFSAAATLPTSTCAR